jgi:hypothetical protein
MFLSIIQTFLRPETSGIEAKLLNLEMLAYNFHESLNLKPLFSHIDRQIVASSGAEKANYLARLNQVAAEITNRQLVLLEQVGNKFSRTVDFEKFRASPGGLDLDPEKLLVQGTEREFMMSVLEYDKEGRELVVQLGVRTPKNSSAVQRRTFHVGFYDFPMIDNTRLSDDQRAAVVLNHVQRRIGRSDAGVLSRLVCKPERESLLR